MNKKPDSNECKQCRIQILWMWFQVWVHVLVGVATLLIRFPMAHQRLKNRLIQEWSKKLLRLFCIRSYVMNDLILPSTPFLLASNHISWMDIHVINAFRPMRFVAKSDVEKWPIFGWMARQLGTIFINRHSKRHGRQVAGEVGEALKAEVVCIFPEGTSTVGNAVLPFRSNLFESAVIAQVPVYSLAISYRCPKSGMRSEAPAFVGDMGLLESMANLFRNPGLEARLTFLPPSGATPAVSRDRKWLALHSQEAISECLKAG